MQEPSDALTGGCLCGKLRYAVHLAEDGGSLPTAHCHCTMCRRASGALLVTFTVVPRAGFRWTQGEPAVYRSSGHAERHFCPGCGSPLVFFDKKHPGLLDLNTGCLDHPEAHPARKHVWSDTRVPWLQADPGLPGLEPLAD